MISKNCIILLFFIITWTCLIETTLAAAGWCYECNSHQSGCEFFLNAAAMKYHKAPCNGQCYTRIIDEVVYRGCSWEHGYMTPQPAFTPTFERGAIWMFCDSPLCNENITG